MATRDLPSIPTIPRDDIVIGVRCFLAGLAVGAVLALLWRTVA